MRCLSIRQPFVAAIFAGFKTVEHRTWKTTHRGPLLIHAGKAKPHPFDCEQDAPGLDPAAFVYGAIVGIVDVVDCLPVVDPQSGADIEWDWHLVRPRLFAVPYITKGRLGLWGVPNVLLANQWRALEKVT
jgi:ASCH domain